MHEQVHTIFIYYILNKITQMRYFVRVTYFIKTLQWFPAMLTCFIWTNQKCNVVTGKSSVKFLKDSEKIQKISQKLNFQLLEVTNLFSVRKSDFNSSISIGLSDSRLWWAALLLNHVKCDLAVKLFTVKAVWPLVFTCSDVKVIGGKDQIGW